MSGSRCQNTDRLEPSPRAKRIFPVKHFNKSVVFCVHPETTPANSNKHLCRGANEQFLLIRNYYKDEIEAFKSWSKFLNKYNVQLLLFSTFLLDLCSSTTDVATCDSSMWDTPAENITLSCIGQFGDLCLLLFPNILPWKKLFTVPLRCVFMFFWFNGATLSLSHSTSIDVASTQLPNNLLLLKIRSFPLLQGSSNKNSATTFCACTEVAKV